MVLNLGDLEATERRKQMRPEESPFRPYWWGTSLEDVGLDGVRPNVGTYGRYDYTQLPPLPFALCGQLEWLSHSRAFERNVGEEKGDDNARALVALRQSADAVGLQLPPAFVRFMADRSLHQRIRSNTDCFLDLCPALVRSPVGDGFFVRFLADSQGCVFWYLYLTQGGTDHAVVSSPGFFGVKEEMWQDEVPDPAEIVFCAESFEEFLCRFWLENEIWYAEYEHTPMPNVGTQYIEQYRRAP